LDLALAAIAETEAQSLVYLHHQRVSLRQYHLFHPLEEAEWRDGMWACSAVALAVIAETEA
jgi:hypothetical protein